MMALLAFVAAPTGYTAARWPHSNAVASQSLYRASAIVSQARSLQPTMQHAQLTLVRHGQSEWNAGNRFTGWIDVDLTERGIIEARQAGNMLREEGLQHDLVCTSRLRRAIRTACLMLSASDQCFVPLVKDVRLNEQVKSYA